MTEATEQAKALGDETRLRIFRVLARTGERLCVCELEAVLGKPQYAVSRALGILRKAELVDEERDGRLVKYGVSATGDFARHLAAAASSIPCATSPVFAGDITAAKRVLASRVDGKPTAWCGCKE
jgi:ArsR family transcriptional regulator, arsenate/arsenite/antimonite-responsive transcriptional repressor